MSAPENPSKEQVQAPKAGKEEKIDKVAVENDLAKDQITEKYKEAAKIANSKKTQFLSDFVFYSSLGPYRVQQ